MQVSVHSPLASSQSHACFSRATLRLGPASPLVATHGLQDICYLRFRRVAILECSRLKQQRQGNCQGKAPLSVLRVPCGFLLTFTQPLRHSGVPLSVLRVPRSFLLTTQPLGHSGAPLSVLRVPGGFLLKSLCPARSILSFPRCWAAAAVLLVSPPGTAWPLGLKAGMPVAFTGVRQADVLNLTPALAYKLASLRLTVRRGYLPKQTC